MDKRVLKKVCVFLQLQKDNEIHFSQFWDKTKDYYPEGQSKTSVRQWLQQHPDRFEIIAGIDGNPVSKIRLKTPSDSVADERPSTSPKQDEEIRTKVIEAINKQDNGVFLFAVLCNQKSDLFPSQLQDKKYIRQWLLENSNYFEMVMDKNGGFHAVKLARKGRQKAQKISQNPKQQQGASAVDRVQQTASILGKIADFIQSNGGSVGFDSLVNFAQEFFPAHQRESSAIRLFLANFPDHVKLAYSMQHGEMAFLLKAPGMSANSAAEKQDDPLRVYRQPVPLAPKTRPKFEAKASSTSRPDRPLDKVIQFICDNGGITTFAAILKQAEQLIGGGIKCNEDLFMWLAKHGEHFDLLPNPAGTPYGQVKVILRYKPLLCQSYVNAGSCMNVKCQSLHICKAFICGHIHNPESCRRSHNIRDVHNKALIHRCPVLKKCSDDVVIKVFRKSCFPRVCMEFIKNKQGVCPRKENCNFLHICGDYVSDRCGAFGCPLPHDLDGLHNSELLKRYDFLPSPKMPLDMVKTNIAYVQGPVLPAAKTSDVLPELMKVPIPLLPTNVVSEPGAKVKKTRTRPRQRRKKKPSTSDKVNARDAVDSGTSSSESESNLAPQEASSHQLQQLSLKTGNVEQSNLNSPLSGHEKVKNWMSSGGGGYDANVEQPSGDSSDSDSDSEGSIYSHSEESVQSSVLSGQSTFQMADLQKKIFLKILGEHNGSVPFCVISRDELFPSHTNVLKWFEDHPNAFLLHFDGRGEIERVTVFSRRCRICLNYSFKTGCSKKGCGYFHICRNLIEDNCRKKTGCKLNHSLSNEVKQLQKRYHLEELSEIQLCKMLQLSTPNVCRYHNSGCCNRGMNCPNVHICKKYVKGRCPAARKHVSCQFGHLEALDTPHAKTLLTKYKMDGQKPRYVCKMLLVPRRRKEETTNAACKEKEKAEKEPKPSKTHIEENAPKICARFLSGHCPFKKCRDVHHSLPYMWQYQLVSSSSSRWHEFDEGDCKNIEKWFCDVMCTAAEINMATKIISLSRDASDDKYKCSGPEDKQKTSTYYKN